MAELTSQPLLPALCASASSAQPADAAHADAAVPPPSSWEEVQWLRADAPLTFAWLDACMAERDEGSEQALTHEAPVAEAAVARLLAQAAALHVPLRVLRPSAAGAGAAGGGGDGDLRRFLVSRLGLPSLGAALQRHAVHATTGAVLDAPRAARWLRAWRWGRPRRRRREAAAAEAVPVGVTLRGDVARELAGALPLAARFLAAKAGAGRLGAWVRGRLAWVAGAGLEVVAVPGLREVVCLPSAGVTIEVRRMLLKGCSLIATLLCVQGSMMVPVRCRPSPVCLVPCDGRALQAEPCPMMLHVSVPSAAASHPVPAAVMLVGVEPSASPTQALPMPAWRHVLCGFADLLCGCGDAAAAASLPPPAEHAIGQAALGGPGLELGLAEREELAAALAAVLLTRHSLAVAQGGGPEAAAEADAVVAGMHALPPRMPEGLDEGGLVEVAARAIREGGAGSREDEEEEEEEEEEGTAEQQDGAAEVAGGAAALEEEAAVVVEQVRWHR